MVNNFGLVCISILVIVLGSLILNGGVFKDFDPDMYRTVCTWALAVGCCIFLLTLLGCAGAVRQIERKGLATGRTLLSLYQLTLIGLLVVCVYLTMYWQKALDSLEYSAEQDGVGDFDAFEKDISQQFNVNYFSAQCGDKEPSKTWFLKLVDKVCPEAMSSGSCASYCGQNYLDCPSESSCDADALSAQCPYALCRLPAIDWLLTKVRPLNNFIQVTTYITACMIFLTCLLICYNPRDDVTEELIKTGLFVEKYKAGKKHATLNQGGGGDGGEGGQLLNPGLVGHGLTGSAHSLLHADGDEAAAGGGRGSSASRGATGVSNAQAMGRAAAATTKGSSASHGPAAQAQQKEKAKGPQRKNLMV